MIREEVDTMAGEKRPVILTGTKSTEVFSCLGDNVGPQFHDNSPSGSTTDGDVKVDTGVCSFSGTNVMEYVCCDIMICESFFQQLQLDSDILYCTPSNGRGVAVPS